MRPLSSKQFQKVHQIKIQFEEITLEAAQNLLKSAREKEKVLREMIEFI